MNIQEITAAVSTEDRTVEFKPAGTKTGWLFTLRHESHPEVEKYLRRYRAKVRDLTLKGKQTALKNLAEENEDGFRLAQVVGWEWEGGADPENGKPEFSKKELKAALETPGLGYHLRKFIDDECGALEDFLDQ